MSGHPEEFAAALIFNAAGEMLLLERAPYLQRWPKRWGIAGGGVEPGETPRQALRRELQEELGRDVRLRMVRGPETLKAIGGYGGRIHIWQALWVDGTIALSREHTRYAWVGPEGYARLDIMPGVDYDLDHFGIWPRRVRKGR
jgi:8-oxo-dGTP diphosphatase